MLLQAGKEIGRIAHVLGGLGRHMIEVDVKIAAARSAKRPRRRTPSKP
jgi:hypothetical protein